MYFKPRAIEVKAGETVRFANEDSCRVQPEGDAATMPSTRRDAESQQSGMLTPTSMASMDHSQMGHGMDHGRMMKHDDPNSVLVGPGKSAELTWTFAKATRLEFACNIPGHYGRGGQSTDRAALSRRTAGVDAGRSVYAARQCGAARGEGPCAIHPAGFTMPPSADIRRWARPANAISSYRRRCCSPFAAAKWAGQPERRDSALSRRGYRFS